MWTLINFYCMLIKLNWKASKTKLIHFFLIMENTGLKSLQAIKLLETQFQFQCFKYLKSYKPFLSELVKILCK